jgi:hypothetical protein
MAAFEGGLENEFSLGRAQRPAMPSKGPLQHVRSPQRRVSGHRLLIFSGTLPVCRK